MKVKGIEKVSVWVVTIIMAVFLLPLVVISFPHSYINIMRSMEKVFLCEYNTFGVLFNVLIFTVLLCLVCRLLCCIPERKGRIIVPVVVAALSFAAALYWVLGSKTYPQADQEYTYKAGLLLAQGKGMLLQEPDVASYIQMYQQQLSLAMFYNILFKLTRIESFKILLILNAICVPVIIISVYAITYKITGKYNCSIIVLMLTASCLPMYFYTSFAYGELISTAFALLCVVFAMNIMDGLAVRFVDMGTGHKVRYILNYAGCFVFAFFAAMTRLNSIIVMIAISSVVFVKSVSSKRFRGMFVIVAVILGALLPGKLSKTIYAQELQGSDGMPSLLWIAMGMQDSDGLCGWTNYYNAVTYEASGYNAQTASQMAWHDIGDRLEYFRDNPGEAVQFYFKKFESQWNCPMYQSVQMNSRLDGQPVPIADNILNFGRLYEYVRAFVNVHQSVVYLFAFAGLIIMLTQKKGIESYILCVAVVGGMLFSLLWEAKARYCFPYYIFMFPMAAIAIGGVCDGSGALGKRFLPKTKKAQEAAAQ